MTRERGFYDGLTREEAESSRKLMSGTAALLTVAAGFLIAPDGSPEEAKAAEMLDQMIAQTAAKPEKSEEIIMALLTVLTTVRLGGTVEEWFHDAGVRLPEIVQVRRATHDHD